MTTDEMLNLVLEPTRNIIQHTRDTLLPIFILVVPGGENAIVGAEFEDDIQKDLAAAFVKKKAAEIGAVGIVFVSEAWTTPAGRGDEFEAGRKAGLWSNLEECPFRQDSVVFMLETHAGSKMARAPIMTLEDGSRRMGEVDMHDTGRTSGRFANLLPKEGM